MTNLSTTQHVSAFPRLVPLLPELLPLLLEGLDLPADFSRCLHIALRCPVLPQLLHIALLNQHLVFSCPALPQQAPPPSFASTDPHLHTTLSRFVEHADVSVVPEIVPWLSPDQQS